MKIRSSRISASIARAISSEPDPKRRRVLRRVAAFFALFHLTLTCYNPAEFLTLRHDAWQMDEDEYLRSFRVSAQKASRARGKGRETHLVQVGDLGYSGSTFFTTVDGKYLVKSLPRRFEYEFFKRELYEGYVAHMKRHPNSLLVRITDMVFEPRVSLGGMLGIVPTHHIVMENLLYGKESEADEELRGDWETYDLKPSSYFLPERDLAGGVLATEAVKDKLFDEFPDRVCVSPQMKRELMELLEEDTRLLADHGAIDYSLFLVRFPGPRVSGRREAPPHTRTLAHPWRRGVDDMDGRWTYRAVVLDFFWAKSSVQAKALTGIVKAFNVFARRGPMSITAEAGEYREKFLAMVSEVVCVGGVA